MEEKKHKKKITICGYSLYYLAGYFTIYSVIGFILETLFGAIANGVIESRKSFLYGPFCAIYGVGAIAMLLPLKYCKKNFRTLFIGGALLGSIVEYAVSLFGEMIYHVKWWDYSDMPLNLNGRICIYFTVVWGILAVLFMQYIHPSVERIVKKATSKINKKTLKIIVLTLFIFQFIDFWVSTLAVEMFTSRKIHELNLDVENRQVTEQKFEFLYSNDYIKQLSKTVFNDNVMLKAFPNLKIQYKDGRVVYFKDIMPEVTPYYVKFK